MSNDAQAKIENKVVRKSYIFLNKTREAMKTIFESLATYEILETDIDVQIIKSHKNFETIKMAEIC